MNLTKGYLEFLVKRFAKCEPRLESVTPEEIVKIRGEILKGNKEVVKWALSVLQIFEYNFKEDIREMEKYLAGTIPFKK